MDNTHTSRARITTRVDTETLVEIERLAEQRRTNVAQVARCLIGDAIEALAGHAARARISADRIGNGKQMRILTGNKSHDDTCLQAEVTLQNSAKDRAANIAFYTTIRNSAIANNFPEVGAYNLVLKSLGAQ